MTNPTSNYGFVLPSPTDLVTDLPADFDVALQGVDTRLKALQPGTTLGDIAYSSATANTNTRLPIGSTGQVLTVAAGVPSWASPSDQTPLTTKGDLFTYSTTDTRLGVGANDTVLTADSTAATGLKWASVPSGGMTLLASGTLSGTNVALNSISQNYENLIIYVRDYTASSAFDFIMTVAGSTQAVGTLQSNIYGTSLNATISNHTVAFNVPTTNQDCHAYIVIPDYTAASRPIVQSWAYNFRSSQHEAVFTQSAFTTSAAAITSIGLTCLIGWSGGTYELWGQK